MLGLLGSIAGPLLKGLFDVVDQTVEDKDQAAQIKAALQQKAMDGELKQLETAANVIMAEAKGDSWLQRSWRPLLMVLFGTIVANNYLVVPLFGTPSAEIPPDMWALLKLGVGGYVVGRSVEKGLSTWKGKGKD